MADPAENPELNSDEPEPAEKVRGRPFQPGQSGNPGGRPKGMASAVRRVLDRAADAAQAELEAQGKDVGEAAAEGAEILVRFWAGVMANPREKTTDRLAASKLLVERGWGKPPEYAPIEDPDPLGANERDTAEIALSFDRRVDELAARRATKTS